MVLYNETLVDELFESDEASVLTNKAGHRIEKLERALEALVQESVAVTSGKLADHTSEVVYQAIEVLDK